MRGKHIPVRTCIGCLRRLPKAQLVRFVLTGHGVSAGCTDGRGFYLCRDISCLEGAQRRKNLRRLLKRRLRDEEVVRLNQAVLEENSIDWKAGGCVICCETSGGGSVG